MGVGRNGGGKGLGVGVGARGSLRREGQATDCQDSIIEAPAWAQLLGSWQYLAPRTISRFNQPTFFPHSRPKQEMCVQRIN